MDFLWTKSCKVVDYGLRCQKSENPTLTGFDFVVSHGMLGRLFSTIVQHSMCPMLSPKASAQHKVPWKKNHGLDEYLLLFQRTKLKESGAQTWFIQHPQKR